MIILDHRGLEPSKENFYPESSLEAFKNHLERGFGIEFDPNFTKNRIVVFHDSDLKRITLGEDERSLKDLTLEEAKTIFKEKTGATLPSLQELLEAIQQSQAELNALHLKGKFQTPEYLDKLISVLNNFSETHSRIVIFDLKPEAAKYLREKLKDIHLAPSVAHPYDIERYNSCVAGTLISIEDALEYKKQGIYDWVWLDEWDLTDREGKKKFYTKENFEILKNAGYKIGLVTPELHGTSPGLLGAESHEDAKTKEALFERIKEIISLNPDLICTDYIEESKNLA